MARAVTRHGRTTIYGPGDSIAGSFDCAVPLDDAPESLAEAREVDDTLREYWLRTLGLHEAAILALRAGGRNAEAVQLVASIERTAHAQVQLATLDEIAKGVLSDAGVVPSERNLALLRRLFVGGRDERTWRRWKAGAQLVPEAAADYLSRIRGCRIVRSDEPGAAGQRLVLELAIDDDAVTV